MTLRYVLAYAVLALTAAFAFMWFTGIFNPDWTAGRISESQRRGDEIVVALERYRDHYGYYPSELKELVPQYLIEVRVPTAGTGLWTYLPSETRETFSLGFEDDDFMRTIYWYVEAGQWDLDDRE